MMKNIRWMCALALALLAPGQLLAQSGGNVAGRVTDAASKQPLANVQVIVAGTALQGRTGPDGSYTIRGVPAGRAEVRVARLGYSGGTRAVTVAAGQTVTANFELASSTIGLDVLVVQASGEAARRRELGNSVATVSTANVEMAAVQNFSQLVAGRAPGVVVLPSSGQLGAGTRIRIRGNNSVSLSNDPLLIIDGVRVDNESFSSGLFTGGQSTSRFEDINPEDIENVEVLKGPAAAALYGTAAANGVIQVTTKRGRSGHPSVRAHAEFGRQTQDVDIPANYRAIGHTAPTPSAPNGTKTRTCDFTARAAGTCVAVDSLYSYNPLRSSLTPFQTGATTSLGASVSGGSENATYFVSGENEHGVGVQHPNHLTRTNVRANLTGQVGSQLRLTANSSFVQSNIELPQADNSAAGPVLNGLLGDPSPNFVATNGGYRAPITAFSLIAWENREQLNRFTGSTNADYRPLSWLSLNGTVGVDVSNRFEGSFVAPGTVGAFADGFREQYRSVTTTFTANGGGTATKGLTKNLISTTSAGVQYTSENYNETYGEAEVIAPGTRTALVPGDVSEAVAPNKLFGAYATEQLALNDRFFITGGLRGDQNSAFGNNIGFVLYPSLTASWVVNEEPFFPKVDALSNLRLRAAYGKSGLRPGRLSALRTYGTVNAALSTSNIIPGFVVSNAGNPDLKPEITREFEFGGDLGFFADRLTFEATHYNKRSHDALISDPLPPSIGGPSAQTFNLGSVSNIGNEFQMRAEAIKRDRVGLDLTVNYSTNTNKLLTFGDTIITPIIFGLGATTQRHAVGFPLGGYWQAAYTYADANKDGLIQLSEVSLLPADQQTDPITQATYYGSPFPKREASFNADLRLARFIRLSGLLDYKGGQKLLNFTAYNRQASTLAFSDVRQVPGVATLDQQAAIQARRLFGTYAGFIEDASFWKLREVSVSLTSPQSLNRSLHLPTQGLSLTIAGRNLHTWTKYTGFDPEVNYGGQSNFNTADDFTLPPTRAITARIDVNF